MHEKLDDLRTTDRSWKQSEVEVPPGHARHRRQRLPVKVILQYRRLSAWRPGTAAVRALAQSALVDEDDRAPLFAGFFLISGQRFCFHSRVFSSSRARCASDLPDANAVCAQPVPLSSGRAVRTAGVAASSGSLTADALPPGGPLPPEELPAATAEPRVSVAAPVPENLAELLLGFPWTDHSRRRPECHYIIQYLIAAITDCSAIIAIWPVSPSVSSRKPLSASSAS